jgi:hypothetical protein
MEQPTHRESTRDGPSPPNAAGGRTGPQDETRAAARIPDSVAVLSYGSRPLVRLGGGPRLF